MRSNWPGHFRARWTPVRTKTTRSAKNLEQSWASQNGGIAPSGLSPLIAAIGIAAMIGACAAPGPGREEATLPGEPKARADEPFAIRKVNRSKFPDSFAVQQVAFQDGHSPGTIVVHKRTRFLYLVIDRDHALRYPIAVGREEAGFLGTVHVRRKAKWPAWRPTPSMHAESPLPQTIAPGPHNPLGARALYLYKDGRDTLLRIHGTSEPWLIGQQVSSGCIRMFDEDVADLFERVKIGSPVVFLDA